MIAEEFVDKIINLRESLDYFNHFDENITANIQAENKYNSEKEFNDEFVRRSCVLGTYYKINDKKEKFENEIERLLKNYKNDNFLDW